MKMRLIMMETWKRTLMFMKMRMKKKMKMIKFFGLDSYYIAN